MPGLALMGNFNNPVMCSRYNTAGHKSPRRFLEPSSDIFLIQGTKKAVRRGALLDLLLAISEGFIRAMKLNGTTGCSNHKTVEFRALRGGRETKHKITSLDFRSTGSGHFAGKIPQHKALGWKRGPRKLVNTSSGNKDHLLQTEEKSIPKSKNSGKNVRRPTWKNKELPAKLRHKNETYRG